MRLKRETLRARCKRHSPQTVEFLDLSRLDLVELNKLDSCDCLHWLIASKNKLQGDEGLENLKQLWYVDLSDNKISGLNALSRYLALGTVILTNNNLQWKDLEHISHAHFLSISLHGNSCLDKDPYYRIHVIDCLPLIWELDGRLVTVTERLHVKQFFIDTELSQHPVRHKTGRTFKTTAIRNIGTEGIVSKQCKYIYSKFPMSETHTKHTDERRLRYLCNMVQGDIIRWFTETRRKKVKGLTDTFLEEILNQRRKDVERCNMLLLLLVISLEFQIPTALMKAVLGTVGLDLIGTSGTMPFFLLPRIHRTKVICILLNAEKVDRDNNVKADDGLYPQLFMCLYFNVARLTHISQTSEDNMNRVKTLPMDADYMALMASEVVSLMLQVPRFFESLLTDVGIIDLVTAAVGSCDIVEKAQDKLVDGQNQMDPPPLNVIHKTVAEMILVAITARLDTLAPKMSHIPIGDRYLALSDSLPIKPLHSVIWASQFLTKGETIPNLQPPILNPVREAAKPKPIPHKMGDKVLLGPQVVGEIASLLEGDIAMVKIDAVPISNGAVESKLKSSEAHFAYVDLKALCFARDIGMWRPAKTVGDKYTIHSTDSSQMVGLAKEAGTAEPLQYTAREEPPERGTPRAVLSSFGLTSQMVQRSQSVGTGYLTGYRHSDQQEEYGPLPTFSNTSNLSAVEKGPHSARNNNNMNTSAKTMHQKKRILSAPATTSSKPARAIMPQQRAIEMNTLHLHDNVHHIRGLTPRAESDRSGALTSPSSIASPGDVQQFQPQIDGTVTIEGPEYTGPETSRTNTPAPVTEEQVLLQNHDSASASQAPVGGEQLEVRPGSAAVSCREHKVDVEEIVHLDLNAQKDKDQTQQEPNDKNIEPLQASEEPKESISNNVQENSARSSENNTEKDAGLDKKQEATAVSKQIFLADSQAAPNLVNPDCDDKTTDSGHVEEPAKPPPVPDETIDRTMERGAESMVNGDGKKDEHADKKLKTEDAKGSPIVASIYEERTEKVTDGGSQKWQDLGAEPMAREELSREAAVGQEGQEQSTHQMGDNCPVCLANAAEATFLTSVNGQGEGLMIDLELQQKQQQPQRREVQPSDIEQGSPPRNDGGFTDENLVPPVGNYGDVRLKETLRPGLRQGPRATSAVPGRARFGLQNQQPSAASHNPRRPQSAVDPTRYFVIDHPPAVVATGQAASMFSHNGGSHFKTDFQHEREEAWRRTTKQGRQRPLTAIVQCSSSQFPLNQQLLPTTNHGVKLKNPGIKITRTDGWLAGGRDLYWEGIRKRPKSGHTPGWLEGLPDSMKEQRPRSAFSASLHQQPRNRLSQRPQSGSALIVSSCYKSDSRGHRVPVSSRPGRGPEMRYMLTFNKDHQQQLHVRPQLQISPQQQQKQQQEHEQLLLLDPELDENPPPLSSPASDMARQEWSFPTMEY